MGSVSIGDGIARVHGVDRAMAGEMLEFPRGVFGIALNLEEESVGAVLLGDYKAIREGDRVKRTGRIISVPVGEEMVGRVVNALGQPIDGKGPIVSKQFREIERLAPGVVDRSPVKEPLQTGLKRSTRWFPIGAGSASASATGRLGRPPLPSTRSSTEGKDVISSTTRNRASSPRSRRGPERSGFRRDEYTIVVAASASDRGALRYTDRTPTCAGGSTSATTETRALRVRRPVESKNRSTGRSSWLTPESSRTGGLPGEFYLIRVCSSGPRR